MMASSEPRAQPRDAGLIWHELECGSYTADLGMWEELAERSQGPILDLGCGSGRVAIHLARRGHAVVGVDTDPALAAATERRAAQNSVDARAVVADARTLELDQRFGLVLAPMQLVQMLPGAAARRQMLDVIRRHLLPRGRAALALVEPEVPGGSPDADPEPPLPDVCEVDGWIYSSLPVAILDDGDRIAVRRLRQIVSPEGSLTDEVDEVVICAIGSDELEAEARGAGLEPADRRVVPQTEDHVGSTVVILEA